MSKYVQKQYLLWTLRDILDIINENEIVGFHNDETSFVDKFDKKLSFTKLYNFLKFNKQYIWNRHIPESSCLCKVCENVCLFAKGINKSLKLKLPTNPHDLIELCSYDSGQSECMDSSCDYCSIAPKWNHGDSSE